MATLAKILLPTDGSEPAKLAARYAGELARAFGAAIVVVHVAETPFDYKAYGLGEDTIRQIRDDLMREIQGRLDATVAECGRGIAIERRVLEGEPFEQIVSAAADEGADLIVIATHGYTGFKHLLLGSVAERVVRTAACPVLTVRHGQPEG